MYSFQKVSHANATILMTASNHLTWLKSGLLWRTFFLLAFLITISMAAWIISFRIGERGPRAQELAARVISVVTLTRAALTHSAPDLRRELLFDLASNEGIRIYPLEDDDLIEPPPDTVLMPELVREIRAQLGSNTKFSSKVNDVSGFWVSFKIDSDEYWLMLDRDQVDRMASTQWLQWASVALMLSLLGAMFISTLINQPLARLTAATRAVAKGQRPDSLPETGPIEIQEANRSFNQMVDDLQRIEADREIILAGISHDLRTPLTRMLLEVEMANLSEDTRNGMHADLAQMDAIIGQFLHYAKPSDTSSFEKINMSLLLEDIAQTAMRQTDVLINADITPNLWVFGNKTELQRVIDNLIENARRYGKNEDLEVVKIDLYCRLQHSKVIIHIDDHGPGIPVTEIERLLRPFTRLDAARGQANGSGLGLAIVSRIVQYHKGRLQLRNHDDGLTVQIELPLIH